MDIPLSLDTLILPPSLCPPELYSARWQSLDAWDCLFDRIRLSPLSLPHSPSVSHSLSGPSGHSGSRWGLWGWLGTRGDKGREEKRKITRTAADVFDEEDIVVLPMKKMIVGQHKEKKQMGKSIMVRDNKKQVADEEDKESASAFAFLDQIAKTRFATKIIYSNYRKRESIFLKQVLLWNLNVLFVKSLADPLMPPLSDGDTQMPVAFDSESDYISHFEYLMMEDLKAEYFFLGN